MKKVTFIMALAVGAGLAFLYCTKPESKSENRC